MPAMAVESGPAAGVVAAALVARQTGRAEPALVRHGRHHGQGEPDPRRPVRDHAGIRGRRRIEQQPLDERHRPSDPRIRDRSGRGVGRRRLDCLGRPRRSAARRPEERRRRSRARSATPAAAPSRRSPTATCCSAISTRARCSPATCPSIMRPPRPPIAQAARRAARRRSRARPRPPSSMSSTMPWRKCSRSSPCNAATIRAISCSRPSAGRDRCMPPRSRASSASPRSSARRSRAPSRRSASIGTDLEARLRAHSLRHDRDRRSRARLEAAFAALETQGRRHARPRRRRAGAAALRALGRCALRAPIL